MQRNEFKGEQQFACFLTIRGPKLIFLTKTEMPFFTGNLADRKSSALPKCGLRPIYFENQWPERQGLITNQQLRQIPTENEIRIKIVIQSFDDHFWTFGYFKH